MSQMIRIQKYSYKLLHKKANGPKVPIKGMGQIYLVDDSKKVLSFWNDIPLDLVNSEVTCCIEIPKESCKKLQMTKNFANHPLMQDTRTNLFTKEIELRCYAQFPLFNYGFIPQTWEQNVVKDKDGLYGDDDPIDVCEISKTPKNVGDIFRAKVLGSFCLIDQGEVDWKILLLDIEQCKSRNINQLSQVDPRHLKSIMNWFKNIKVFDGKPANRIAYADKIFNEVETVDIIKKTHQEWQKLVSNAQTQYAEIRKKYHFTL